MIHCDRVEELLSDFNNYSKNGAITLSFRKRSCRCRVPVPKGIVALRVEDILSVSETKSALHKEHRTNT
jgi:hypothetical protein